MINKEHRFLLRDIHRYINQINKINESKLGEQNCTHRFLPRINLYDLTEQNSALLQCHS